MQKTRSVELGTGLFVLLGLAAHFFAVEEYLPSRVECHSPT